MTVPHPIQHPDVNVGPAYYHQFGPGKLLVTNIFRTLQGEGPYVGHPAVFIRLSGCNRGSKVDSCEFCDTSFEVGNGNLMDVLEISRALDPYPGTDVIVITGGEPFIQDNLMLLLEELLHEGRVVQVETNGDRLSPLIYLGQKIDDISDLTVVVSPKAARGVYKQLTLNTVAYASVLKYLVEDVPGSPYYQIPDDAFWWRGKTTRPIYISPITTYSRPVRSDEVACAWDDMLIDKRQTAANYRRAAQLALKHNLIVSIQTHLFLNVA